MRIIAGKFKGKKLFTPSDLNVRPTGERAREALFSMLFSRLGNFSDCRVLDVFAGTGAFGFEALSRGAKQVTFVDINTTLVKKNADLFKDEKSKIKIINANALNLGRASETSNLLFMDAPYAKGLSAPAINELATKGWLEDGALCLIETHRDEKLELSDSFKLLQDRTYGIACVHIFEYKN